MITKDQKKALRKLLAKKYSTVRSVNRIVDDIELSMKRLSDDDDIITAWDDVLDKASDNKEKWTTLVELLEEEMDKEAIKAILDNNDSTEENDSNEEIDSTEEVNSEGEVTKAISKRKKKGDAKKKAIYKNHLLVIGINDYSNGIPVLNNAYADAQRFHKVLTKKYQFDVDEGNCIFIENKDATKKKILDTFKDLTERLTPNDNLIYYFSGHGDLDKITNIGYWIPADAINGDTSTYIPNSTIKSYLSAMKVQHSVGIIDACFSGSMVLRANVEVAERYYNIPSRWIMTSGVEEVVPDGKPGRNSPFATSLLTHLEQNTEDVLGLSNLWLRFREGIIANSKQTPLCQPVQDTGHQGGEFFFLLKDAKIDGIPKSSSQVDLTIDRSMNGTDFSSLKLQMMKLVSNDELEEVFEVLTTKISSDSRDYTTVLVNRGSYNRNENDNRKGIVNPERYQRNLNITRNNLLSVIKDLEEDDLV